MSALWCSKPLQAQNARWCRCTAAGRGHSRPARAEPVAAAVVSPSRIWVAIPSWVALLLRWGRRSFEWRWRAIALATAGCALPAPCAELRAARAAALSIRPLTAPAASPHPTTSMDTLPLSLLCLERLPLAVPTSQCPTSPMERGPLARGRCEGATLGHPKVWVCLPLWSSRWPRCTRVVLNANLTSQRERRGTTYAQ